MKRPWPMVALSTIVSMAFYRPRHLQRHVCQHHSPGRGWCCRTYHLEELVAACETIKAAGFNCMTAGGGDGWPIFVGSYGLLGAFYPDQAGLVEGLWTGDIQWNDETTLELWNRYQIYATEMLEPGVTGLAHDAAIARYAAGDVAFAPDGQLQAPALEDAGPEFDWTYIPFPGSSNAEENQFLFGKYDQTWAIGC